ncbi:hypothetical protein BS47DRAFT_1368908 [Hydnum rufescens UP504]|uniref:Uncharacterized protein n=1 Tax=Hydnum rufescens UP504 TaxID=1448309 RepID=A0A9P6AEK7_9AGAM|nr:hypothetical protein BS47DRAFT_1368908 [Hydnum rufescens UP504]
MAQKKSKSKTMLDGPVFTSQANSSQSNEPNALLATAAHSLGSGSLATSCKATLEEGRQGKLFSPVEQDQTPMVNQQLGQDTPPNCILRFESLKSQKYVKDFILPEDATAADTIGGIFSALGSIPHYDVQEFVFMKPVKMGIAGSSVMKSQPLIPHVELDPQVIHEGFEVIEKVAKVIVDAVKNLRGSLVLREYNPTPFAEFYREVQNDELVEANKGMEGLTAFLDL